MTLDSQPVAFNIETVGNDAYVVLSGPTGQHSLEIVKGSPATEPAADAITEDKASPTTSVIPNPEPPVETVVPTQPSTIETSSETNRGNDALAGQFDSSEGTETVPANPGNPIQEGRESHLRLIHYIGTGLVVLAGLGLITLITFRSRWR